MDIIKQIAEELQIKTSQAETAVRLIDEGNTIPFIARYRKEATGALNDEVLRNLYERLNYLRNLEDNAGAGGHPSEGFVHGTSPCDAKKAAGSVGKAGL